MTGDLDAATFQARLWAQARPEQREAYRRYFPGDESFIGVRMGAVFALAKEFLAMPLTEIEALLESPVHEDRAGACSVMGKSATHKRVTPERQHGLYDLYLRRHDRIDDWDLVDLAAHQVLGTWLLDRPRDPLYALARSDAWPQRRSAIVATAAFLKHGQVAETLAIARLLVDDPYDLVHKGTGWMLRYAGQVDRPALLAFLGEHTATMPRAMLRAAVEKLEPDERAAYLSAHRDNQTRDP
ncbi:DNA alkylation repair protein [Actinotalea sp. K2]|uniref:DNA alkylation repair protein n=1 Tax=Actinotalea sp. K2 TaxID=2939438 RepID=UPI002016F063|nr:DNA alkylation repair protein [Actinotalea sp. K2]MCL3861136.1 DNA alkylation repair protein [Actinotalea sp. K2]